MLYDVLRVCLGCTTCCACVSRLYDVLPKTQEEREQRLRDQARTNDFHRFVDNHLILHQTYLDKRKVRRVV